MSNLPMDEAAKKAARTPEQKRNDRFSFVVGMVIALVVLIAFTLFFTHW